MNVIGPEIQNTWLCLLSDPLSMGVSVLFHSLSTGGGGKKSKKECKWEMRTESKSERELSGKLDPKIW